ncbi:hypothetical protein [Orenia marismortui]|uniref:Outer membrane protein with beta-barrel domain n=1 Tax=Orenia marismortui TaxID=46469 RepID=A0A4R8H1Y6_9FIRM|nr:hypothetical protein [Orenia marismortui]TDX49066.1 hypothetical protein C7959_12119 [Orenia marismortui]
MRRFMVIAIISFLLCSNTIASANNLEFNGGVTYNNFVYSDIEEGNINDSYWVRESLNSGKGFYLEGVYWIGSKYGLGLGLNNASSSWSSFETYNDSSRTEYSSEYDFDGYYGKLAYKLTDNVRLNMGLGHNQFTESYYEYNSWEKTPFEQDILAGDGLGVIVETQIDYPINDHVSFISNFGYGKAKLKLNHVYDWDTDKLVENSADKELIVDSLRLGINLAVKF